MKQTLMGQFSPTAAVPFAIIVWANTSIEVVPEIGVTSCVQELQYRSPFLAVDNIIERLRSSNRNVKLRCWSSYSRRVFTLFCNYDASFGMVHSGAPVSMVSQVPQRGGHHMHKLIRNPRRQRNKATVTLVLYQRKRYVIVFVLH